MKCCHSPFRDVSWELINAKHGDQLSSGFVQARLTPFNTQACIRKYEKYLFRNSCFFVILSLIASILAAFKVIV